MGICCTRNETTNEEILNSFNRNESDFSDSTRGPELSFESKRFDNNKLNTQLKILISNMSQVLLSNVKKITFIELWNIALLYKDNHTSSVYLLYDMRDYHSRKENFLKKMRHINYSYDELRMMPNDKLSNFKRFINGKKVIFIFPDEKIDQSSEIINFISELKSDILNLFLKSTLEQKVLSPYTNKSLFFIEEKDYEYLSYILFAYSHLSNLKKEGFSFIYFIPSAYNNDLLTSIKERKEIYQNFIESFNISSIVYISKKRDNEIREFNDMEENAKSISKIAYICEDLNSIIQHREVIEEICAMIRSEMERGHSFEFVINESDVEIEDSWLCIVILILWKIMNGISPQIIMNYLEYKCMFIPNLKNRIINNMQMMNCIFKEFGMVNEGMM